MRENRVGSFLLVDESFDRYCKCISNSEYQFTQIQWIGCGSYCEPTYYVEASNIINVANMSVYDVKAVVPKIYHNYITRLFECLDKETPSNDCYQSIAECLFENKLFRSFASRSMSLEMCVKYQHDWMLKNS